MSPCSVGLCLRPFARLSDWHVYGGHTVCAVNQPLGTRVSCHAHDMCPCAFSHVLGDRDCHGVSLSAVCLHVLAIIPQAWNAWDSESALLTWICVCVAFGHRYVNTTCVFAEHVLYVVLVWLCVCIR